MEGSTGSSGALNGEQGRTRRGRARDPEVDEAILAAAMDLLVEQSRPRGGSDPAFLRGRPGGP